MLWLFQASAPAFNPGEFIGAGIVVVLLLLVMRNQREDTKQFLERLGEVDEKIAGIPGAIDAKITETRHTLRGEMHQQFMRAEERQESANEAVNKRLSKLEGRRER